MSNNIAKAYADAIYLLALEDTKTSEFNEQLKTLCIINENNSKFVEVMKSPKIDKDEKKKLIEDIYKDKLDVYILNFIKLLIDKNHYSELNRISMLFEKQYYEDNNIATAYVTSASELDVKEIEQLKMMLETKTNKNILIEVSVDSKLIAGIKVNINGEVMDNSIATKLDKIKTMINDTAL